jgi:hypothetical protein
MKSAGYSVFFPELKREPGENPGLPRSGKQERNLPSALIEYREAADSRKLTAKTTMSKCLQARRPASRMFLV